MKQNIEKFLRERPNDQQFHEIVKIGFKRKYLLDHLLDNELSNWRWNDQNKVISLVEKILLQLTLELPKKPLEKLNDKEYAEWTENKKKLLSK